MPATNSAAITQHGEATRPASSDVDAGARHLLAQMTLDEKIGQMSGDTPMLSGLIGMARGYNVRPFPAGENRRLGVPALQFTDGPRGVVMNHSTCFPVAMARGATWDPDLEERVGDAIGVEARSLGANFFAGICINVLRHPAWGRAQETFGEDPFHLGEMGAALVRGAQRHLMACIKHFACNSIEDTRMTVDVRVDERTLREVYLPHFKRCIDEGAAAVMSAYNKVNGEYCGHNRRLLRDILKSEWGFGGLVMSDFMWGIRDAAAAANSGMDVEMPLCQHYAKKLRALVESGRVSEAAIDEAALRVLRQKLRFAQRGEPRRYGPAVIAGAAHRALAREVAQKSMVLLQNRAVADGAPVLPIDLASAHHIAVIGHLATAANTGDGGGSSRVRPPSVVTPLQGLQAAVSGKANISFDSGRSISSAVTTARRADVAVIVAGLTAKDEGEKMPGFIGGGGGDRKRLTLGLQDEEMILAVAAANPHVVVVLVAGGPLIVERWRDKVAAILMAWYPGMEGGHAVADVLLGVANPCGRLPCVFPTTERQLPPLGRGADRVEYGYYHGYRLMDKNGDVPAFPFGFGLSYTTFVYSNLQVSQATIGPEDSLAVSVDVTNTGRRSGDEVVQLYVRADSSAVDRPTKDLRGFAKVTIDAGETRTVRFSLSARSLAYYDVSQARWVIEPIAYRVLVGPSATAADLLCQRFSIHAA